MFKTALLGCLAIALLPMGRVSAAVLENFESETTSWSANGAAGGSLSSLANSTEDPYAGTRSLKIVDKNDGHPYVESFTNHGDLSALNTTYVEFAIKLQNPQSGWLANDALKFYFGTSNVNRFIWIVREQAFLDTAPDANGWYTVHLEFDGSGIATTAGMTLNGNAVAPADAAAGTIGTVDWSSISYMSILPVQASGSDIWTTYVDQIVIGEAVPEPASLALLGLGALTLIMRRQ